MHHPSGRAQPAWKTLDGHEVTKLTIAAADGPAAGEAIVRAEAARRGMVRLLAVAGHDLKQPLQVALISIERAVFDGVEPRAAGRLAMAIDALQRLGRELDELARSALAGGPSPRIQAVPLAPLLAQAQAEWQVHADHRGVRLHVQPTSLCARTDASMLATILRNLVGNAIAYVRPGGQVVLGCRRRGGNIVLEVHDNGPGIAPERLESLFEAGDRGGRRDGTGLGLGLYIVRETARALGHPVRVRSRIGRGSTFGVTLQPSDRVTAPVAEAPDDLDGGLRQTTGSLRSVAQLGAA
ncbi:sensor histidine kinase [Methylobacterium sp. ID0610]|uniref:sensor histidine kinase n=1 Tax=Methylobacterium carpenticola TaxID=3344827 RepID=UPI00367D0840